MNPEDPTAVPTGAHGPTRRGRRSGRDRWSWREWYLTALLVGAGGFCLGPSLVGARTLLSVDMLTQYYPWRANGLDTAGHEVCTGDTIDANLPQIAYVRRQLFGGHLGSWQSLLGGGGALSGIPNNGLLDPLSLPYFLLPLWLAPAFVVLLSGIAAIAGTYLFLRRLTVSGPAALLAGFVFTTSGFMVMWTNWPQTRVAALIPALFWTVERLLQRRRLVDSLPIAVVVASMLLGGFPEVTGFALYAAGIYVIVRLAVSWRRAEGGIDGLRSAATTVGLAASGLVIGGLLSAVQMLPFLRFYQSSDLSYRAGESTAGLPLSGLTTLVAPNVNGLCIAGRPSHGSTSPIELVAYVGAAALVLAVAGAAFGTGRRAGGRLVGARGYFAGLAAVAVLLGWVSPTARAAVAHLPVFSGNFIGRIRSVLGFALAGLAAVGFELVVRTRERPEPVAGEAGRSRRGPDLRRVLGCGWAVVVVVAVLVVGALALRDEHRAAFSGGYWPDVRHALWIPAVLAVATVGLLVAARRRAPQARTVAFVAIPILVVAQGAQFFHTVLPGDPTKNFYPDTATHRFLAAHLGHDRFASSGLTMYPSTALYYGLRTATGHVLLDPTWQQLLVKVDPAVMQSATFSDFSPAIDQDTVGDQPILDRMGIRYFVQPPENLAGTFAPLPATDGSRSSAAGPLTCTLPAQALRGITVHLTSTILPAAGGPGVSIDVRVTGAGRTISSGHYVGSGVPAGKDVSIALAGESIPAGGDVTVTVSAAHAAGPLVLAAAGGGVAWPVTPKADGLRLVFADPGSIVYQRLDALPRIRWADRSEVIPTADGRIAALAGGVPGDEVVLDSPGPATDGRGARVSVTADTGDQIAATVAAAGRGYLVVADAMQARGWSVSVDGHPARLVPADDAMVVVAVPAGTHLISFTYRTPDQIAGASLTAVGIVLAVTVILWNRFSTGFRPAQARRRRRRAEVRS